MGNNSQDLLPFPWRQLVKDKQLAIIVIAGEIAAIEVELANHEYYARDEYAVAMRKYSDSDYLSSDNIPDAVIDEIERDLSEWVEGMKKRIVMLRESVSALSEVNDLTPFLNYVLVNWSGKFADVYNRLCETLEDNQS